MYTYVYMYILTQYPTLNSRLDHLSYVIYLFMNFFLILLLRSLELKILYILSLFLLLLYFILFYFTLFYSFIYFFSAQPFYTKCIFTCDNICKVAHINCTHVVSTYSGIYQSRQFSQLSYLNDPIAIEWIIFYRHDFSISPLGLHHSRLIHAVNMTRTKAEKKKEIN